MIFDIVALYTRKTILYLTLVICQRTLHRTLYKCLQELHCPSVKRAMKETVEYAQCYWEDKMR